MIGAHVPVLLLARLVNGPGIPCRQTSNRSLEDSFTTISTPTSLREDDPPLKVVARTASNDSLPLMPRRQASGRSLNISPCPSNGRKLATTSSPARDRKVKCSTRRGNDGRFRLSPLPNGGRRMGPPPIPRRQASSKDQHVVAKSKSMPAPPRRLPSFKGCVGSTAA